MTVKSELDDKYHDLIDDETFSKYGHIYYGQRRDKKKWIFKDLEPKHSQDLGKVVWR